jgi:hypothetical protein
MGLCEQCNEWVPQTEGKKKRRFCNETCRSNFWYAKNIKGRVKLEEPQTHYDAPPLPNNSEKDIPHVYRQERLSKDERRAIQTKYVEDRRDITDPYEFKDWQKRLQNDDRLTKEDKEEVKNSR